MRRSPAPSRTGFEHGDATGDSARTWGFGPQSALTPLFRVGWFGRRRLLRRDGDGVFTRDDARAVFPRVGLRELRAQEENVRRVVDPDDDGDQRAGRSVALAHARAAEV